MATNHKMLAIGAFAGAVALAAMTTGASAFVACNDRGDCWHSGVKYEYPNAKVIYYGDDWDWKAHNFRWHESSGDYGYWDSDKDAWVTVHPAGHDSDDH
jgi:hypothetical protein